ncbi:hypothetical protein SY88_09075 [Clostridiales bacterium PH28_bin88]|nr:hypothetical protein SY88_09075 [Clostridiales bacterium PH28_bin88]
MSGRSGKRVAPKENITRAEVAVIVRRLLQGLAYTDMGTVPVSGRSGKRVASKENITRAEVAVIVRRLLQGLAYSGGLDISPM